MKRFKAEYSADSIVYWPCYTAGKALIFFFSGLLAVFLLISLWTLLDGVTIGTRWEILIAIPIVVALWCIICRCIFRKMHTKIVISNIGVICISNHNKSTVQINWEDVVAVYFIQDNWYGRHFCRIYKKKESCLTPKKNDPCNLEIPVFSVDEQRLLNFIPIQLRKNSPSSWI